MCGLTACGGSSETAPPPPPEVINPPPPTPMASLNAGDQEELGVPLEVHSVIGTFEFDSNVDLDVDQAVLVINIIDSKTTPFDEIYIDDVYIATESGERVTDWEDAERIDGHQLRVIWNDAEFKKENTNLFVYALIYEEIVDESLFQIHSLSLNEAEDAASGETVNVAPLETWPTFEVKGPEIRLSLVELENTTLPTEGDSLMLASIQFDTTDSGEDVLLETFRLQLVAPNYEGDLDDCELRLEDGTPVETSGNIDRTSDGDETYYVDFEEFEGRGRIFAKNEVTLMNMFCQVQSDPNRTFQWNLGSADYVDGEGFDSFVQVTVSVDETPGTVLTVE